ncbi:hypothetical protein ABIE26_005350 [Pedobacter africanus]|uniref:Uncharacterized protein n=1 Tax=Pedobacter africanus TaxID=151894 RepID=A0ACC6L487_9SPHI|nr:hypothetical protein [Pedobacter africanus]MDR6786463.1 hypothetical protein [Pedobacter africanus]
MKRSFLLAFALIVGVGGALANNNLVKVQKAASSYTYYLESACDQVVTCDDQYEGTPCSIAFDNVVVYDGPSCLTGHEVVTIQGKLPLE